MTERRQGPNAGKSAATLLFLTLILIAFLSAQSVLALGVLARSVLAPSAVLLMLMSAIAMVYWHCYRRDNTSPRRVGRRI